MKRANIAYLEEAVKNGYHMCIALLLPSTSA